MDIETFFSLFLLNIEKGGPKRGNCQRDQHSGSDRNIENCKWVVFEFNYKGVPKWDGSNNFRVV